MLSKYFHIQIEKVNHIVTIWLNRLEVRNAFNEQMITELTDAFLQVSNDDTVRVVVLRGRGKVFCAGADLNWMREMVQYDFEQNYADSLLLAKCLRAIYDCPKPTIAVAHGAVIGGGNGLVAACDISIAEQNTIFALTEVRVGIIPACIAPFIIKRVGESQSRLLMLTAQRISADKAQAIGLVNVATDIRDIDQIVDSYTQMFYEASPKALEQCKKLIHELCKPMNLDDAMAYTANMIATARISEQGQEGMNAFLEKRNPNWM